MRLSSGLKDGLQNGAEANATAVTETSIVGHFKHSLFALLYGLVPHQHLSASLSGLLIALSFGQLLSLMILPDDSTGDLIETIGLLRLFPVLQTVPTLTLFSCMSGLCAIYIVVIFTLFIMVYLFPSGKAHYYASVIIQPLFWVLSVPMLELLCSAYRCTEEGTNWALRNLVCWEGAHYVYVGSASVLMIPLGLLITIATVVSSVCSSDFDSPFAHYPSNFETWFTLTRVAMLVRPLLPGNLTRGLYRELMWNVPVAFSLLLFVLPTFPYYTPQVSWIFGASLISVVIMTLCHVIIIVINTFGVLALGNEPVFLLCIVLVVFPLSYKLRMRRLQWLFTTHSGLSVEERDLLAHLLVNEYATKMYPIGISPALVHAFINRFYDPSLNPALDLAEEERMAAKQDPAEEMQGLLKKPDPSDMTNNKDIKDAKDPGRSIANEEDLREQERERERAFVRQLILSQLDEQGSESQCALLQQARISVLLRGNLHYTYAKVIEAEDSGLGFQLEFAAFALKKDLTCQLKSKQQPTKGSGAGALYKVLRFEQRYKRFLATLTDSAEVWARFWTELKHEPDFNKVHALGIRIMSNRLRVSQLWHKLNSLYSSHSGTIMAYSRYLADILGATEEALNLQKKLPEPPFFEKGWRGFRDARLFSNAVATLLVNIVSTADVRIVQASSSIHSLLGYEPQQLVGKSLTLLMPEVLAKHHPKLMGTYFKTGSETALRTLRHSFAQHRHGHILPIIVAKQQILTLRLGLMYVGSLQIEQELAERNFLLTDSEGKIEGVTKGIAEFLRISPAFLYSEKNYIQDMCPDLSEVHYPSCTGTYRLRFPGLSGSGHRTSLLASLKRESGLHSVPDSGTEMGRPRGRSSFSRNSSLIIIDNINSALEVKCELFTISYQSIKEIVKVFKLPRFGLPTRANVSGKAQALEELLSSEIIPRQLLQRAEPVAGAVRELSEDDGSLSTSLNTGTKDALNRSRNRSSRLQLFGDSFRFAKRKGSKSGLAQSHDETPNSPEAVDDSLVPWLHPQSQGHSKLPIRTRAFGFERGAYANVQADVDTNPTPNSNANVNVNGSADIEGKQKESKSSEETLKKVRALRERSFESFYPDSVRRLKWLLILFTVVLLFGTVYRFCLALVLNQQFAIYGPLVITCAERMAALGRMGKSIWDLILTQPNSRGLSVINATLRDNQFNYRSLCSIQKAS